MKVPYPPGDSETVKLLRGLGIQLPITDFYDAEKTIEGLLKSVLSSAHDNHPKLTKRRESKKLVSVAKNLSCVVGAIA